MDSSILLIVLLLLIGLSNYGLNSHHGANAQLIFPSQDAQPIRRDPVLFAQALLSPPKSDEELAEAEDKKREMILKRIHSKGQLRTKQIRRLKALMAKRMKDKKLEYLMRRKRKLTR